MEVCIKKWLQEFLLLLHLTALVADASGRCSLFGRHHIHTFDGVLYEFPGDCSYLLAGDCKHRTFTLLGDFVDGKRTGVTLFLGDAFELHLSVDGQLSQGDKRLSLPHASHGVFVGTELGFYKLSSEEFGFTVTIDNAANIALTLTKHHTNHTCGLCGNFNTDSADEYIAQEALRLRSAPFFAASHPNLVLSINLPSYLLSYVILRGTPHFATDPKILSGCRKLQTSSVFLRCAHLVSPEAFVLLCEQEVCYCDQTDGEDCYCPFLLEFARTCHAHGVPLHGWQEESQCFPKCPTGMQYSECTKSCSTTCHSLNIQEVCKEDCMDGCRCPVGKVLDGTRCVEVSQCSCVHMGRHFPPGSSISQDCNTCWDHNGQERPVVSVETTMVTKAFGQSWRINGDCDSGHKYENDPCAVNPKRVRFAEEACSVILSDEFSACHFLLNPGPFQRICRYDVCACVDSEECLCTALSAYAAACAARGVLLSWRSHSLCEMKCTGGQVYEACGSVCQRTCRSLSGLEPGCKGEKACEEGCFCPAGKYLSDSGECVTADLCTCLHDGQLYQPNDVYADHNSICQCEKGAMHCSSPETSASLSDLFYDDDFTPSRVRRSAQCAPPLIRSNCDVGENGLECARTCQNLDLPCVSLSCIPGCLCPPGTVGGMLFCTGVLKNTAASSKIKHADRLISGPYRKDCIAPEQCPCYHNNRPYTSGQSIAVDCNTCVCENRKWRCTEKVCDGVCRTVGESHYISFDGLKYSFPGLCQYVLVQ
ncbi:hypothetical protein fugu_012148, partial [Takifugu bimaculatus]